MNNGLNRTVVIYTDHNFLASEIFITLIKNNFYVKLYTADVNSWNKHLLKIFKDGEIDQKFSNSFKLLPLRLFKKDSVYDYALFLGGFINSKKLINIFKGFVNNMGLKDKPSLAIFPFEEFSQITGKIRVSKNAGLLFVGDLLGNRAGIDNHLFMSRLINQMINRRVLEMPIGEVFCPVDATDVALKVFKYVQALKPIGKKAFYRGKIISSNTFWKLNLKYFPGLRVVYDLNKKSRPTPVNIHKIINNKDADKLLEKTYRFIISNTSNQKQNIEISQTLYLPTLPALFKKFLNNSLKKLLKFKITFGVVRNTRFPASKIGGGTEKKWFKTPKIKKTPFIATTFVVFFPFLISLVSAVFLLSSVLFFTKGSILSSQKQSLVAKTSFVIGKNISNLFAYIPVVGRIYKENAYLCYVGENVADIFSETSPTFDLAQKVFKSLINNKEYNSKDSFKQIANSLEYVYKKVSLFQLETKRLSDNGVLLATQTLTVLDIDKLRNMSEQASRLALVMPEMLGDEKTKSYLVLFQNNMELRPTGGFIGSYGIADFSKGKLTGLTVNDIYSADGQLKGHISPPKPIEKYLGEANWYFRDSNWDPDFSVSANRAEWFLEKEMGIKVDGTVAVDLNPIRKILSSIGPVFLSDYNLSISAENIYEKTQEESHENFFPGSRKKASFLTALSRVLINELGKTNSKQNIAILRSVYESLESKSIQVNIHNENAQSAIDKLSWSGKDQVFSCGDGCYSDFYSEIEANFGVNKANYFIERNFNLNVTLDQNKITRELSVNLKNTANTSLGQSGIYKPYIRLFIPLDAELHEVKEISGESVISLTTENSNLDNSKEIGFFATIPSRQSKTFKFVWSSDLGNQKANSSYGLYIKKQAGTNPDPLTINIFNPNLKSIRTQPVFSLTKSGSYTYNTTLDKDFFGRATFK